MNRGLLLGIAVWALGACTPKAEVPASALDVGWIPMLLDDPTQFSRITDGEHRQDWVLFHQGNWITAAHTLPAGPARARAALEAYLLQRDLAALEAVLWARLADTWARRAGLPPGSALPVLAAVSAGAQGDKAAEAAWLDRAGTPTDPDVARIAEQMRAGGVSAIEADVGPGACLKGRVLGLEWEDRFKEEACAVRPLITEQGPSGPRVFYNPIVYFSAMRESEKYLDTVGGLGALTSGDLLQGLIFSGWWSEADRAADLRDPTDLHPGARGPSWATLPPPAEPTADAARERVASLDAQLDPWTRARTERADPQARELLEQLDLVGVYRSALLLGWARDALRAQHPEAALVYAQQAQDLSAPRALTPRNTAGLYVVLARAWLQVGHVREALDALSQLHDAGFPMDGLVETLSDLAVLEGLGRLGDSKEN